MVLVNSMEISVSQSLIGILKNRYVKPVINLVKAALVEEKISV